MHIPFTVSTTSLLTFPLQIGFEFEAGGVDERTVRLREWLSTRVPRNPRVPPVEARGFVRSCKNTAIDSKF